MTFSTPSSFAPKSIALVDNSIDNAEELLQGLTVDHVVTLNSEQDGVAQITQQLASYSNLASIHIFTHGTNASVQLGSTSLNAATLNAYRDDLAQWGQAMSESGDLLLYGCNVASTPDGLAFIQQLSQATNADVAASDDLTGDGGNWQLEAQVGSIEAPLGVDVTALQDYTGTLLQFTDVTAQSGLTYSGESHGGAWGDVNNDGLPDLFLTNHNSLPTFYLNQGDGTFIVNPTFDPGYETPPGKDTHGTTFTDFDNDGDQDLLVVTGADFGTGTDTNLLYVNENGVLTDRAADFGIDYGFGRGRTPLWLDYDQDGKLDLVLSNLSRSDDLGGTTIFRQTDTGFEDVKESVEFNVVGSRYALASDINRDGQLEILVQGTATEPFRQGLTIYDPSTSTFDNLSSLLPDEVEASDGDIAIADFNGDLRPDIFVARNGIGSGIEQTDNGTVELFLQNTNIETGLQFSSTDDVFFDFKSTFELALNNIYIGSAGNNPSDRRFTLSADDPANQGIFPHIPSTDPGVYIGYDSATQQWQVLLSATSFRRLIGSVNTTGTISNVESVGFDSTELPLTERLLINTPSGFVDQSEAAGITLNPNASESVVAGDFDNDKDVDIYIVGQNVVGNRPNTLYENQGDGTFVEVLNAGGAAGSNLGVGESVFTSDYDQDGFLDLLVTNGRGPIPVAGDGPTQLFRNDGNGNNWVQLDLEGVESNRDGIGAQVYVTSGGTTQLREQNGGVHKHSQNDQRLHFGLATDTVIDELRIVWPSGIEQVLTNVDVNQVLSITEAETLPPPVELIENPGFEEGVTGWNSFGGTPLVTTDAFAGSQALELNTPGSGIGQAFDVTPGETYQLTAYARTSSDGFNAVGIRYRDVNGVALQTDQTRIRDIDWTLYDIESTVPDNAVRLEFFVLNGGSGGSTFVDDISLQLATGGGENQAPEITSGGGQDTAAVTVDENQTAVVDVESIDPDGDTEGSGLTYSITDGADQALFSIDADTGVVTFNSAPDFETPTDADADNDYELQVTVTDSEGLSDSQAITVTVTAENSPVELLENPGFEEGLTGWNPFGANPPQVTTDAFAGSQAIELSSPGSSGVGQAFDVTPGETYQLTAYAKTTSDGFNGVGLRYRDINGAPLQTDQTRIREADWTLYDIESTVPENAVRLELFVVNGGNIGSTLVDEVSLQLVTDGGENQAPEIISSGGQDTATVTVDENQTSVIDVEATDTVDAEGAGLTYSITDGADQALFAIDTDTGVVTFNSAPDFEAPADADGDNTYELQVTVTDSEGLTDVQDIVVTVADVAENTAPAITSPATVTVDENQSSVIDVEATDTVDAEGAGLTYSITDGADQALFAIDTDTGVVTFNSAPDFEAPADADVDNNYELQVTVTDSEGLTDVQDIVVTVADVTENPSVELLENQGFEAGLTAWTFFSGTEEITSDAFAGSQALQLNTRGSGARQLIDIIPGETYQLTAYAKTTSNRWNGLGMRYRNSNGNVVRINQSVINSAEWTLYDIESIAPANAAQLEIFVFNGGDTGATNLDEVSLKLVTDTGENQAPEIVSGGGQDTAAVTVDENQTAVVDVDTVDPEGDTEGAGLTYSITDGADQALFSIDADIGVVTFNSAPDFEAPADADADNDYELQVTVTDSEGLSDVQDIVVTVADLNEDPFAELLQNPGFEAGLTDWIFFRGTESITSDAFSGSRALQLSTRGSGARQLIDITPGETYQLTAYAKTTSNRWNGLGMRYRDSNGNVLQVNQSVINSADWTLYDIESIAPANAAQLEIFVFNGGDTGATNLDEVSLKLVTDTGENQAPEIVSGGGQDTAAVTVDENQTAVVDVDAVDPEGETEGAGLTYSITDGADQALFAIDADTGVVTFNSAPDFEAPADADGDNSYQLQVTVTDSEGLTDVQDIAVSVADVTENTAPVITSPATVTVDENQTSVIDVETTDTVDSEGVGLTYSITDGADQALFVIDADTGVVTFNSAPDFEAPTDADADNLYELQVTVTDSEGLTDVQDIAVSVADVLENTAPVITSNGGGDSTTISIDENTSAVTNVEATDDGDSEGSGLTYSLQGPDLSQLTINPDTGELSFVSAPDFETPTDSDSNNQYEVDVVVTDSQGATDTQSITITVQDTVESGIIFFDDFETNQGWVVNPNNSDTATTGQWEISNPEETGVNGIDLQLGTTVSGTQALVTDGTAGPGVGSFDIDNGWTSIESPQIVLPETDNFVRLAFSYYLAHLSNADNNDLLRVTVVGEQTSRIVLLEQGDTTNRAAEWTAFNTDISDFAGQTITLLIEAQDGANGSLVEAAIEDVAVEITTDVPQPPTSFRLEAEDFETLQNYTPENGNFASGGQWIRANNAGTATTTFTGTSGSYNIVVGYYDENDGNSPLSITLNNTTLDSWTADNSPGGNFPNGTNLIERTVATNVLLSVGDIIQLLGTQQGGEFARFDYVDFIAVG